MSAWTCKTCWKIGRSLAVCGLALHLAGCSTPSFFSRNKGTEAKVVEREIKPKAYKELKNPVKFHLSYAKLREEVGDLADARNSYEVILAQEPNHIDARLGLARISSRLGQTADAEERYRKIIADAPKYAPAHSEAGQFYARQQRYQEAVQLLDRAVQIEPENSGYRFHLGVALASADDLQAGYNELNKIMSEPEAHQQLAQVLYDQGNFSEAERHLTYALKMKPDLVAARNLLDEMHGRSDNKPVAGRRTVTPASGTSQPGRAFSGPTNIPQRPSAGASSSFNF